MHAEVKEISHRFAMPFQTGCYLIILHPSLALIYLRRPSAGHTHFTATHGKDTTHSNRSSLLLCVGPASWSLLPCNMNILPASERNRRRQRA